MNTKFSTGILIILCQFVTTGGQEPGNDNYKYKMRVSIPLVDYPQNVTLPGYFPSMNQSLQWSADLYEAGFMGIEELGNKLFIARTNPESRFRKASGFLFKYTLSLGFSKYGSELPVPLGVWGHEEFHRAVLGVNDISSKNGNWLANRWDGTVYGVTDQTLDDLKASDINNLLYSYVAGVQYEIALNEKITLDGFYYRRSMPRAALALYNAWYVFDYFRFAVSPASDSVKILAPPHESSNPAERDFAGADLTAWIYDMFDPGIPYTSRDDFPEGEGVNRRIGFSDLSPEGQDYLEKQKKLSLLNFLNPMIIFLDRIKINNNLSFSFFTRYSPAHFGNDISFWLPVKYKKFDLLVNLHRYGNRSGGGQGVGLGLYNYPVTHNLLTDFTVNFWNQPVSFFENRNVTGGHIGVKAEYRIREKFSLFLAFNGKTQGWILGNPYLGSNAGISAGVGYSVVAR